MKPVARQVWNIIFWFVIIMIFILLLSGCTKKTDTVESATNLAHQQIIAIKESLPKECHTKAIEEQLKAHDISIDVIKNNCEMQKSQINGEKLKWKWSFFALVIIIFAYIAKKVLK